MQVKPGYWDIPQMQKQNITLELLEPGAIIGVSEILSSVSCPTAIGWLLPRRNQVTLLSK